MAKRHLKLKCPKCLTPTCPKPSSSTLFLIPENDMLFSHLLKNGVIHNSPLSFTPHSQSIRKFYKYFLRNISLEILEESNDFSPAVILPLGLCRPLLLL